MGRTFAREEQGEGHDDVVVISERLWSKRFNSDPALIGKTLLLNGRSYTVIGVMPKAFEFPIPLFNIQGGQFAERVDIWKPLAFTKQELESRGSRSYGVIGRLRAGTSVAVAQAELDSIVANWKQLHRDNYDGGTSARNSTFCKTRSSVQCEPDSLSSSARLSLSFSSHARIWPPCFWLARAAGNANLLFASRSERVRGVSCVSY